MVRLGNLKNREVERMDARGSGFLRRTALWAACGLLLAAGCARQEQERAPAPDSAGAELPHGGPERPPAADSTRIFVPPADGLAGRHPIQQWQVDGLRREGLADPVTAVVRDLYAHPGLIPFPGVLGGTMSFYDTTQVYVLNDRWVYAYFEDGHISGYGLFQYTVGDSGRISWRVVDAFLD